MKQQIIGVDLDGVVADFNRAYRSELIAASGRDLIPEDEKPPVWDYAVDHYGYTPAEDDLAWARIRTSHNFWANLTSLYGAYNFLHALDCRVHLYTKDEVPPQVYFITNRVGLDVKGQSESWLNDHGVDVPTVLIAKDAAAKGAIARGLGLTHFIDDRPRNCVEVRQQCPSCRVYLMDARYNQEFDEGQHDIARVRSLEEFGSALLSNGK